MCHLIQNRSIEIRGQKVPSKLTIIACTDISAPGESFETFYNVFCYKLRENQSIKPLRFTFYIYRTIILEVLL